MYKHQIPAYTLHYCLFSASETVIHLSNRTLPWPALQNFGFSSYHPNLKVSYHLSLISPALNRWIWYQLVSWNTPWSSEPTVKYMHLTQMDPHRKYDLMYSSHWKAELETPNRWDPWRGEEPPQETLSLPSSVLERDGADICQGPQTGDRQPSRSPWNMHEKRMLCLKK